MLSIDEAIAHAREVAEKQRKDNDNCEYKAEYGCKGCADYYSKPCIEYSEEHEQLAEWLEELKALKNGLKIKCDNLNEALEKGNKIGYNKALDDFVKFANTMPTVEVDGEIRPMWLEEMAEQLKAGGNIELSEHSKSQGNRTGKQKATVEAKPKTE